MSELTREQKLEADNLEMYLLLSQCRFRLSQLGEVDTPLVKDVDFVLEKRRKKK